MSLGTVRLINATFYARHGVTQEEHRLGGRFEVDAAMHFDFRGAAEADDLTQTVDYEQVYGLISDLVTGNSFYLIERIAFLIAERLIEAFPMIESVEVTVRKINPAVGGSADRAEATWRVSREAR